MYHYFLLLVFLYAWFLNKKILLTHTAIKRIHFSWGWVADVYDPYISKNLCAIFSRFSKSQDRFTSPERADSSFVYLNIHARKVYATALSSFLMNIYWYLVFLAPLCSTVALHFRRTRRCTSSSGAWPTDVTSLWCSTVCRPTRVLTSASPWSQNCPSTPTSLASKTAELT